MLNFNIEVPDINKFNLDVDLSEILDEASAFLVNRVLSRYLSETDPNDVPWIPSKAGMARRLKGGTGTLYDTGRLYGSIQVYKTADNARRVGTDVPYGEKLQMGDTSIGLPPRVFLGFSKEDVSMVTQIVQRRITEALT